VIEVKHLVKKYGNHVAVNDLSFSVERGEILGFLGPNGAGKSTTMNMITGYISATEGTVVINGHDIFDEPEEAKKSIGYLPELPPLYLEMTVKEYLSFAADLKKVPKREKKDQIAYVMKKTGIVDVQGRLIKHLSKGYRQRVGLAQAIIGHPDLIILDEPTVGLDPMQIVEIRGLIKELSKEHAVILSSHILAEISAVCDKVLIINQGKLIVSDTPDNLSKRMKESNAIELLVRGEKTNVHNELAKISKIRKIEYRKQGELLKAKVYYNPEDDIREALFYAMVNAGCPILSMEATTMTLEDIFMKVTKQKVKSSGRKMKPSLKEAEDENIKQEESKDVSNL